MYLQPTEDLTQGSVPVLTFLAYLFIYLYHPTLFYFLRIQPLTIILNTRLAQSDTSYPTTIHNCLMICSLLLLLKLRFLLLVFFSIQVLLFFQFKFLLLKVKTGTLWGGEKQSPLAVMLVAW